MGEQGLDLGWGAAWGGAGPGRSWVQACSTPAPAQPQHLQVWLASEKAHERQRAVNSCVGLLKFLSDNLYLDVSTWLAGPTPHTTSAVPAKPVPPRVCQGS